MSRPNARNLLILAIVVLGVCSLLPARFLGWVAHGRNIAITLTAPVQAPLRSLLKAAEPEQIVDEDVTLESLSGELARADLEIARLHDENEALRAIIEDLQRVESLIGQTDARPLVGAVIGGADFVNGTALKVRGGTRQGVSARSTIAVLSGTHLVGRVVDAGIAHCLVQPITAEGAGSINCRVMLEGGSPGPPCFLQPTGDGTLFGTVGSGTDSPTELPLDWEPKPGMVVRVDDGAWPRAARMLIVGQVEKVEPSPDQPLRKHITVRPQHSIEQAARVVLMIPEEESYADVPGGAVKEEAYGLRPTADGVEGEAGEAEGGAP